MLMIGRRSLGVWLLWFLILSGCVSAPRQISPVPDTPVDVENLDAAELMQSYGALLRARVREDDRRYIESDHFKRLQQEIAERKLVTKKTSEQIAQGIVFLGMSREQMMAALDSMELLDQATFDHFLLKMYRSSVSKKVKPNNVGIAKYLGMATHVFDKLANEVILTCTDTNDLEEKTIGLHVWGRTTFDTYFAGTMNQNRIRTNFSEDFFDTSSVESQSYTKRGAKPPDGPKWEQRGDLHLMMQLVQRSRSSTALTDVIEERKNFRHYKLFSNYLASSC